MKRVLIAALCIAATSLTLTAATAAPAAADATDLNCTTASYTVPDVVFEGGTPVIHGWAHASYVGSYSGFSGTYRLWHYTYQANGGGTHYTGAAGVLCNAAGQELSSVDLTRETLTASDHPKCGTTSYTVGSNSYTYLGSRYNDGDKFRYWGQTVFYSQFVHRGPAAVRCN